MFGQKTHFEQVPLEIVRKIVEDQIQRETTTVQDPGANRRTSEDLFGVQERSGAKRVVNCIVHSKKAGESRGGRRSFRRRAFKKSTTLN
jgi:hypothetical protein